jgi:hypothetical protein
MMCLMLDCRYDSICTQNLVLQCKMTAGFLEQSNPKMPWEYCILHFYLVEKSKNEHSNI